MDAYDHVIKVTRKRNTKTKNNGAAMPLLDGRSA
jgi:hypothetical protein